MRDSKFGCGSDGKAAVQPWQVGECWNQQQGKFPIEPAMGIAGSCEAKKGVCCMQVCLLANWRLLPRPGSLQQARTSAPSAREPISSNLADMVQASLQKGQQIVSRLSLLTFDLWTF